MTYLQELLYLFTTNRRTELSQRKKKKLFVESKKLEILCLCQEVVSRLAFEAIPREFYQGAHHLFITLSQIKKSVG